MGAGGSKKAKPETQSATSHPASPPLTDASVAGRTVTSVDSPADGNRIDNSKETTASLRKPDLPQLKIRSAAHNERPGFLAYDDDESDEGIGEDDERMYPDDASKDPPIPNRKLESPDYSKKHLPPARGARREGGVKRTDMDSNLPASRAPLAVKESHREQEVHHPKFDKERFKKANKERMNQQSHSDLEPPPATVHHFSRTMKAKEQETVLDESDEDFMAEILRETDFVVADRERGML